MDVIIGSPLGQKKLATESWGFVFQSCHVVCSHPVQVPLCMVDLAQTIEEWKDLQSVKVDDQVGVRDGIFALLLATLAICQ